VCWRTTLGTRPATSLTLQAAFFCRPAAPPAVVPLDYGGGCCFTTHLPPLAFWPLWHLNIGMPELRTARCCIVPGFWLAFPPPLPTLPHTPSPPLPHPSLPSTQPWAFFILPCTAHVAARDSWLVQAPHGTTPHLGLYPNLALGSPTAGGTPPRHSGEHSLISPSYRLGHLTCDLPGPPDLPSLVLGTWDHTRQQHAPILSPRSAWHYKT